MRTPHCQLGLSLGDDNVFDNIGNGSTPDCHDVRYCTCNTDILLPDRSTGRLQVAGCTKTIYNMSEKPSTSMIHVSYYQMWGHPCTMPSQETGWQSGVRSYVVLALPTHLLQELNVGTVDPSERMESKYLPNLEQ